MSKFIFVISFLLLCTLAHGASFDCNNAKSRIEKMICSNAELSSVDEELAKSYFLMKTRAKKPDLLTQNQLEWLKYRDKCKEISCLLSKYKTRIQFVSNWLEYEKTAIPKADSEIDCTDRPECWPEGSAMNTGLLLVEKLGKFSVQLESKFDELINLLSSSPNYNGEIYPDSRVISALKAQQVSWEKYRTDECELIGSLTGAGGAWPSTYATECDVNLTEERLWQVKSAIKCIKKIPLKERWMEQANCLQQLAPLANKK